MVFLLVLLVSATAWLMSVLLIATAATVQKKTFFLDKLSYFLEWISVYIKAGLSIHTKVKRQTKTWTISLMVCVLKPACKAKIRCTVATKKRGFMPKFSLFEIGGQCVN